MTVIVLKLQSANLMPNLVLFVTVPNTLEYSYVHPNMVMMPSLNVIVVNFVIRSRDNFFSIAFVICFFSITPGNKSFDGGIKLNCANDEW